MTRLDPSYISCGVYELNDLGGGADDLETIAKAYKYSNPEYDEDGFAFIVFSDIANNNGDRLAARIKQERLGILKESPERTNPNSLNTIKVWIWAPNFDRLVKEYG